MKLLDLIHPHFGAISICNAFIGDSRREHTLDLYDESGRMQIYANYHQFANLALQDKGFESGLVRLEFDDEDVISKLFLEVWFGNQESLESL